jgi:hypothetical protein
MPNELVKRKIQSFWDTKEGTTGMIVGFGILGGIGYGAYKLMPYIANLAENTFYAVGFIILTALLLWVFVLDNTFRNRAWLIYKLLMRALTYQIIKYDPVGVLRETQEVAATRVKTVDKSRLDVKRSVSVLNASIEKFKRQMADIQAGINVMVRHGRTQEDVANEAMKIGRLEEAINRTTKSYTMVSTFYEQLCKAQKALETIHSNIDFEINVSEEEYRAATAASNAWQTVRAAFKGSDASDLLQADAFAFLAQDYAAKIGEIESFMTDSQKFIDSVDLQNAVYTEKGMRLLEDLNTRDLSVVQVAPKIPAKVSTTATDVNYLIRK